MNTYKANVQSLLLKHSFRIVGGLFCGLLILQILIAGHTAAAKTDWVGWCQHHPQSGTAFDDDYTAKLSYQGKTYTAPATIEVTSFPINVSTTHEFSTWINNWAYCTTNRSTGNGTTWTINNLLKNYFGLSSNLERETVQANGSITRQHVGTQQGGGTMSVGINAPSKLNAWLSISTKKQDNTVKTFTFVQADIIPPTFTAPISINGGAAFTNALNVNVSPIQASDPSGIKSCSLRNKLATSTPTSGWQNVACNGTTPLSWSLDAGSSGLRTVEAQVCDNKDNCGISSAQITFDNTGPEIENLVVQAGTNVLPLITGTFFSPVPNAQITFQTRDLHTSINTNVCHVEIEGSITINDTCSISGNTVTTSLPATLEEGLHRVRINVQDALSNPTTVAINVFIDTQAPTYNLGSTSGEIGTQVIEPGRQIRIQLPIAFEDTSASENPLSNSGIRDVRITLTPSNQTDPFILDAHHIEGGLGDVVRIEDNVLILTPKYGEGSPFPETITFLGLPATTISNEQIEYAVYITAFDMAGNELVERPDARLHKSGLRFDTLSPLLQSATRLATSSRLGNGTAEDPYRVGSDKNLRMRFLVTERTNNSYNLASTPITAASIKTFLRNGEEIGNAVTPSATPSCSSLDSTLGCSIVTQLTPIDNFDGRVEITVRDNAGNVSAPISFWVKQDSNRPVLLSDFALTANVAENEHFKGTLYKFTASGINKNGSDKQLTAFISYINEANESVTVNATMSPTGVMNQYRFDAALNGVKQGQGELSIVFEDNYGNRHQVEGSSAEHTVNYSIFHDSLPPQVSNFAYEWSNNDVNISYSSVSDLSFPVQLRVESSEDGISWVNYTDVQSLANEAAAASQSFTLENVPENVQLRVTYEDTVKDYIDANTIGAASTPNTFYIVRDIVLSVEEGDELLRIGYVPETTLDLSTIASYDVTYSGPHGRTGRFDSPTVFNPAGALLGNIDAPLKGTYTFNTRIRYNDGTPDLVSVKSYEQLTDILDPRGTLSIAEVAGQVRFDAETSTYYVRSNEAKLALQYTVTPQYEQGSTRIYDDSLPIHLRIEGADINAERDLNFTTGTSGSIEVELLEDKLYTLQGFFTDQAGRSTTQQFRVIKDRAEPQIQTRFLSVSDGAQFTLTSIDADDPATTVMTRDADVFMDVIILNEDEPVTLTVARGSSVFTTSEEVPGLLAGQQGARFRLSDIADAERVDMSITALDRAGFERIATTSIRRDISAPALINGAVEFTSDSYKDNPVPISAEFKDYTQVFYTVTVDGTAGTRTPYAGALALPEGRVERISVVFEDALENKTEPYIIDRSIYIDSIAPTGSLSLLPSGATRESSVSLIAADIVDASPFMTWEASRGGNIVGSGTVLKTFYEGPTVLGQIPLELNKNNTLSVVLRDSLSNTLLPVELTVRHDDLAPVVTFAEHANNTQSSPTWLYTVSDGDGVGVQTTDVSVLNISNGRTLTQEITKTITDAVYKSTWENPLPTAGHTYALAVRTTDTIGNTIVTLSEYFTYARGPLDEHDPRLDPITIPETLTGSLLKVTMDNGRHIRYVAENMPRGTALYLADVLDMGENELATGSMPRKLSKFPIGYYTLTLEDEVGNRAVINNYLVTPYYFDPDADIDGDGFGGGISDHKLVKNAEEQGTIYTANTAIQARLNAIKALIRNNISTRIAEFLQK